MPTPKTVFWNELTEQQEERNCTPAEIAEIEARIAGAPAMIRASKWEDIKATRDRCKNGGVLVGGNWFHTDPDSRIQIMGLVIMGANIPANTMWKTMAKDVNGNPIFVVMTKDLANAIFLAIAELDKAAFAKAEEHRTLMQAAPDPNAYSFSAGWPTTYPTA